MTKKIEALPRVIRSLERFFGSQPASLPTDPFQLVLWENVAYLANDVKRREAFAQLADEIGLEPVAILNASKKKLQAVTARGILSERFAEKLREVARIAIGELGGDLEAIVQGPVREAKKALRLFPGIGEPGAEKILLLAAGQPFLAPDSNALRVLERLGLCPDQGSYAKTYKAARELAAAQIGDEVDLLKSGHHLLRRLGQEICKNSRPRCEACPLAKSCPTAPK